MGERWSDWTTRLGGAVTDWGRLAVGSWQVAAASAVALACLLVAAFAFPLTGAAGLASVVLVALGGAAATWAWSRTSLSSRQLPRWVASALTVAIVAYLGHLVFGDAWSGDAGWYTMDWGPHHALVSHLVAGLEEGEIPRWVHSVSTGDSPYELYPPLPYYIAARLAILFDCTDDIPLVLLRMAIATHVLLAIAAARLAQRIMPWPLAVLVGVVILIDQGDGSSGGASSVLYWGLLHNAVALCFWLFALTAVVDSLRRPRLSTSVAIWIFVALGTAAHPIGLVMAAAAAVALVAVACFARDVPARRPNLALFHVAIGVALGAVVWAPLSERLLNYAVHYGAPAVPWWRIFETWFKKPLPAATFEVVIAVGYVGALVGLFSRRAGPTLVAALAAVLVVGVSDELYLLFDLEPSPGTARFSAWRLLSASKPILYVSAGYLGAVVFARILADQRATGGRAQVGVGALAALVVALFLRGAIPYAHVRVEAVRDDVVDELTDPEGMAALIEWAGEQATEMRPEAFGRLLYDGKKNTIYHVNAETGLPTLWIGQVSDLLLRERIENSSAASLRRFNVRWFVRQGASPPRGDPDTERSFGSYRVRERREWDGKFARIEKGQGEVVVTHMSDEHVDVVLSGTTEPALVALGMGYYPRWRARHEDGRQLSVYAMPAIPEGKLHVVAAWIPPGRTRFAPDGSLPSDGKGWPLALIALVLAVAIIAVWSWPRARLRVLRRAVPLVKWLRRRGRRIAFSAGVIACALMLASAIHSFYQPAGALQVGTGLTGGAYVQARAPGGTWRTCPYSTMRGSYRCADLLEVRDASGKLLKDVPPSWPFVTPSIKLTGEAESVEYRVGIRARLQGSYMTAARGTGVELTVKGVLRKRIGAQTKVIIPEGSRREVILTGTVGQGEAEFGFVRERAIEPRPSYPTAPDSAPAALLGR